MPADTGSPARLAHMVYFTLKDGSAENVASLLAACDRFLTGHPGTIFYAAGTVNPDLSREVNVRDYHVGLHVVFDSRASHDAYQVHPRHLQFIEENKPNWAKVRVFDTDLR